MLRKGGLLVAGLALAMAVGRGCEGGLSDSLSVDQGPRKPTGIHCTT